MATHFVKLQIDLSHKIKLMTSHAYKPDQRKKIYVLYVGRLSSDKGLDLVLSAFENLPYELKIIGDGPLRRQVELQQAEEICNTWVSNSPNYQGTL